MLSETSISRRRAAAPPTASQNDASRQRCPPLRDARSSPQRPAGVAGTLRRYQDGPRALRGHSRRYWGGRLEVYPDVVTCDKGGVANYQGRYIAIGGGAVPPTGPGVPERCVATTLVAVVRHPSVPTTTRGRCRDASDKSGSGTPPPLSGKSYRLLAMLEIAAPLSGGVRRYLATNPGRGH